jgi:hypothetical protein
MSMSETTTEEQNPSTNGSEPPTVVAKEPAYRSATEATELIRSDAGDITATTVTMEQSGAEQITADRVTMDRSGAKSLNAKSAQLDRSGALSLKSDHVVLQRSSAIAVMAKEARVVRSKIFLFRSNTTTVEGELRAVVHIGSACDNVKPLLSGMDAARFGVAFGATVLIGGRLIRRLAGGR